MKRFVASLIALPMSSLALAASPGQSMSIDLPTHIPHPCIAVQVNGARILLSEDELKTIRDGGKQNFQNEDERLAWIASGRASMILNEKTAPQDETGCALARWDSKQPKTLEAAYLIGHMLESRKAIVIRDGRHLPETRIDRMDINNEVLGMRMYRLDDGHAILSMTTFVR
ncbi:hypothetical protein [Dyella sp.]|uniref:hypothetical protein n=1 Tax=Dyella sp. TaxID=1869338 RepID=UPI002ED4B4D8